MKTLVGILLSIPSPVYAWVTEDIREDGGGSAIGAILAGIFGLVLGYPILYFAYSVQCIMKCERPNLRNIQEKVNISIDKFATSFLLAFVYIMPFILFPILLIVDIYMYDFQLVEIYAVYTGACLITSTIQTLVSPRRKDDALK